MFSILLSIVVALCTLLVSAYFYVKHAYSYWQRCGVKSLPAKFPFGNFEKQFRMELTSADATRELYRQTDEPILGVYGPLRPVLLLRDPEIIRNVLVRDAQTHFLDRGLLDDESVDPLVANIFSASGAKWRNLRQKLSPTFTTGKLKAMFSTMIDSSAPLTEFLTQSAKKQQLVDVRGLSARYATNIIASVAFGIEINCIDEPNAEFWTYGQKIIEPSMMNALRLVLAFTAPKIMKILRIRFFAKEIYNFMSSIVTQNMKYREQQNVVRKDFFQLLVQLRNKGVQSDGQWETEISNDGKNLTLDEVTAQVFIFFLAGFETSASAVSFCLYEVAKNVEIQRKVQDEIDRVLNDHGGEITYDSINELKYLEACIDGKHDVSSHSQTIYFSLNLN